MICGSCGKQINDKAVVCIGCNNRTALPVPPVSYQPMAGFFLSLFFPLIALPVTIAELIRAIKRKGLWIFPLLGLLISLTALILTIVLSLAFYSFFMEILAMSGAVG